MKGGEKTSQQSCSLIVNAQPKPKDQNASCSMEQALQENNHTIAATKPVNNGNKLGVERCRAPGQLGESVLDEPACNLSVPVWISCLLDQILEVKENHREECRPNCDGGDNYGIFDVFGVFNVLAG